MRHTRLHPPQGNTRPRTVAIIMRLDIHGATDLRIAFVRLESNLTRVVLLHNGMPVAEQHVGPSIVESAWNDMQIALRPVDSPEESLWIGDASGYLVGYDEDEEKTLLRHRCGWTTDVSGWYMGNIIVGPMREHRNTGCRNDN